MSRRAILTEFAIQSPAKSGFGESDVRHFNCVLFTIRMGDYRDVDPQKDAYGEESIRRPLHMGLAEPVIGGERSDWSGNVDAIAICISGSKTDWVNQGKARSPIIIPEAETDAHSRPIRGVIKLRKTFHAMFHMEMEGAFATWMSGKSIKPDRAVSILRMDVSQQGVNPTAYSSFYAGRRGRSSLPRRRQH